MAWDEATVTAYRCGKQKALSRPPRRCDDAAVAHGVPQEAHPSGRDAVGNVAAGSRSKHLLNEQMNTRMETVDAYMQVIPPGSRSGKHRHLAEECLHVVEGHGYDMHQDCDVEITDTYEWKPQDEVKRYDWEAGDVIYVPPCTIHQHFNGDPARPARLISCINRIYKNSGLNDAVADRRCAGI